MSETEMILLIVFGFSLASLLALFTLRLVWAAAVRAGVRRMQRQVPSSLAELHAERTRLLAENAHLTQRLEAERDAARQEAAERLAEVNRHRNRQLSGAMAEPAQPPDSERLQLKVLELERALHEARQRENGLRRALAGQNAPDPAPPTTIDDREMRLRQRIDKLNELMRARDAGPGDNAIHASTVSADQDQGAPQS